MQSVDKSFRLDGEIALITGGGTGLGFGIAQCFVNAGAKVVLVGRRENVLADACAQLGPNAVFRRMDVNQYDQAPQVLDWIINTLGPLTILVNNAGIHLKKPTIDTSIEEFKTVLDTHVFAAMNLSQHALKIMVPRKKGNILFIASMASLMGIPQVVAYSAAKSAYVGMVRAMSADHAGDGVRVNAIAPGWIQTPMLDKALSGDEARRNKILSRTHLKQFGDPADIGLAATYLCSPAARFVTGVVLPVDGGASIGF